jgi:hypothetical protein
VSQLVGACPALQFTVNDLSVTTDVQTDFARGRCRDLSNGDTVTVTGTRTDGSIDATKIQINKNAK